MQQGDPHMQDREHADGSRSRVINDRMSANICRNTAISAIWNLT
jgi:aerobic-type carbon monoxide dehydrogenase small subunit (CoxS/CutS family)